MAFSRGCLVCVFTLGACTHGAVADDCTFLQNGIASIYNEKLDGQPTASGEKLDMNDQTAAHRSLDFGTRLKITDRKTGKTTFVRINDRGPFIKKRVIDVSRGARLAMGWPETGLHRVRIAVCK